MDSLLTLALPLSLAFMMFSLGLGLTIDDFKRVFLYPRAVVAGAICQVVLLPVIAFTLVSLADLPPVLAFGVMLLSFCPGGVSSNMMTKLAGGAVALSISLTGIISLLSMLTIPFLVIISGEYFLGPEALDVNIGSLGVTMFLMTAVPVSIGLFIRHKLGETAIKMERIAVNVSTALFAIIVVLSLAENWPLFSENFIKLGPLLAGMNILLLAVGILIGRVLNLGARECITIAMETGVQNSTLGITLASLLVANQASMSPYALPSAVYGIIFYLIGIPFILWARSNLRGKKIEP